MLDYLVLYQSESGNTKKIAASIFAQLPGNSKDLIDISTNKSIPEASVYFIGYCVHRGSCGIRVEEFLNALSGKQIALFATCGMGTSPEYYRTVECSASAWIESDNRYLGAFVCQGKMPQAVRRKYLDKRTPENADQIDMFIRNFDEALTHPDSLDIEHCKVWVSQMLQKVI